MRCSVKKFFFNPRFNSDKLTNKQKTQFVYRLKHERCLRIHIKFIHPDTSSEPVKCTICNKMIKSKSALTQHIRRAHGERRHQCTLCDKSFKRPTNLKVLLLNHTKLDRHAYFMTNLMFDLNTFLGAHSMAYRWIFVQLSVLWQEIQIECQLLFT